MEYLIRPYTFNVVVWNKLLNLEVIKKHRVFFDEELLNGQDKHFCARYFQYCNSFAYDPVALYHYSQDTGGVTRFSALNERKMSALLALQKTAELLQGVEPSQSGGLLLVMTVLPFLLMLISYLLYKKHYTLDEPEYDRICEELESKKKGRQAQ